MPHQNKSKTEDTKWKKANEPSVLTNSTVFQDATSLLTGSLAEGKAQPSTDPVQSCFLAQALNEGGRDERLFSNLPTAKSIYNFKISESIRKMFVLHKSILCTLVWFLTSQISSISFHKEKTR